MKLGLLFCVFMVMNGCALIHKTSQSQNTETPKKYIEDAPRDRRLVLNGVAISESDFGGVERWFAVDKYGKSSKVRFQVGCFKNRDGWGYVLYEGGTEGVVASCYREGLNVRWNWVDEGENIMYSIIIKAGETGYYYEFPSVEEKVLPRETFKVYKF